MPLVISYTCLARESWLISQHHQEQVCIQQSKPNFLPHTKYQPNILTILHFKGPTSTNSKVYNDIIDINEITSFGASRLHGPCDAAVINTGKALKVPTAIICPPAIYGIGKGPVKTRNGQLPFLTEAILKRGKAFTINEGKDDFDCKLYTSTTLFPNNSPTPLKPYLTALSSSV